MINVCAPGTFDLYDSYGLIACRLVEGLLGMGERVQALALGDRGQGAQPDVVRGVTGKPIVPSFGGIMLGYPTNFHRYGALLQYGVRIAVTMFESSRIPPGWADSLNRCDSVVVPSEFCSEVFVKSGVTSDIRVIPLGINDTYRPHEREDSGPLTFLAFLDRGKRKGGVISLRAFLRAFGDDPGHRLILKGRRGRLSASITNPNIELIQEDMTEEELYELYKRCHVLINPHKGEGFGLIPREFAATGGVALTTGWSGTCDGIDRWGWAIPYSLETADWRGARNLEGLDLGVWAAPDEFGLTSLLRHVSRNRDNYLGMAYARAELVREMYDWGSFSNSILGLWRSHHG